MVNSSPWFWKLNISALIAFVFPLLVHAQGSSCDSGGDGSEALRACKKFSCQAQRACNDAATSASSKNDAEAAQLQNQYKGKSQVTSSSYDLSGLGTRNAGSLGQAAGYCRSLAGSGGSSGSGGSKTCQSVCDPNKISPSLPRAQSERQEMDRERQACLSAISKNAESLDQGKKDNQEASKDAQKTGDQAKSDGGKGGEKGEGEQKKGEGDNKGTPQSGPSSEAKNNDPTQQNCDGPNSAKLASCSSKLEGECTGAKMKTDARCQAFAEQYCGSGFSGPESAGTLKRGSGASSSFCRERLASNFCSSPGRSNCPSCNGTARSIGSASGAQLAQLCGACASGADIDPIFSDPQVASACRSSMGAASTDGSFQPSGRGRSDSSASGSSGVPQGGGGLGASGTSAALGATPESSVEAAASQFKTDIGGGESGGGGGGGYSYGGSSADPAGDDYKSQSTKGGSGTERGVASDDEFYPPSDVMKSVGPNVFSIQSAVIRNRCESGRLLHCEKGKR